MNLLQNKNQKKKEEENKQERLSSNPLKNMNNNLKRLKSYENDKKGLKIGQKEAVQFPELSLERNIGLGKTNFSTNTKATSSPKKQFNKQSPKVSHQEVEILDELQEEVSILVPETPKQQLSLNSIEDLNQAITIQQSTPIQIQEPSSQQRSLIQNQPQQKERIKVNKIGDQEKN